MSDGASRASASSGGGTELVIGARHPVPAIREASGGGGRRNNPGDDRQARPGVGEDHWVDGFDSARGAAAAAGVAG